MARQEPTSTPSQAAFLVKLWIDDGTDERDRTLTWRGQIQHVQTGESRVFRGPFQMLAFMDCCLMSRGDITE